MHICYHVRLQRDYRIQSSEQLPATLSSVVVRARSTPLRVRHPSSWCVPAPGTTANEHAPLPCSPRLPPAVPSRLPGGPPPASGAVCPRLRTACGVRFPRGCHPLLAYHPVVPLCQSSPCQGVSCSQVTHLPRTHLLRPYD